MPRTSYDRSIRVPKPYLGGYIVRVINSPALTLLPGYSTQIGLAFYYMLLSVDQHLAYMDPICDFLYHLKYMLMGDRVKDQVEKIICTLRPAVKLRLRFITHSSKMEPASAAASAATAAASAPQPPNVSSPAPQSSAQGPVNVPLSVAQ